MGNKIYELRTKQGWSQDKLAELLGMTGKSRRQKISRWESGQFVPSSANLIKLSAIFGVSINDILGVEKHGN